LRIDLWNANDLMVYIFALSVTIQTKTVQRAERGWEAAEILAFEIQFTSFLRVRPCWSMWEDYENVRQGTWPELSLSREWR